MESHPLSRERLLAAASEIRRLHCEHRLQKILKCGPSSGRQNVLVILECIECGMRSDTSTSIDVLPKSYWYAPTSD